MTARPDKPLAEHTAEPWKIGAFAGREIKAGIYPVAFARKDYRDESEAQANARRIVACVNACAGIADPAALRASHDALVNALEQSADALEGKTDDIDEAICCSGHECGCLGSTNRDLLSHNIRTALATAKELSA